MLQQFSWGHFLVASIMFNLVWYGLVVLVYCRKELLAFFSGEPNGSHLPKTLDQSGFAGEKPSAGQRFQEPVLAEEKSLMGVSKLPVGVEVLSCSQVAFSGGDGGDNYEQVGLVADLVQELKLIFSELEKTAGDKRDFFRLLARVKEEYGPLYGHPSLGWINQFIAQRAGFHLTPEEIDNLWY